MTYSSWVSNGTNVAYEPKEKNTGEVITSFSTTAPGGVPNSSYAPSTYVLAASGAWIAQTVATAASEVRRPSVYTPITGNPSPYFIATNTNLVYDADANHITTYGAFELAGLQVQNDASFTYTVFQTKAQTWTSCTLNISRNYASTQWTSGTEARFYLSTDSGSNWTLLLTDDYDSDPITVAIFSHTLATVNPSSLSAYQVKVEIDAFPSSAFNSVGVLYLQLYDIWIEGIYAVSGGSGTVTSITTTGANGVTISGGSTQTITTSGTFALALGNITPTSITTGTGSFSGDVEFAASIKSPTNSPVTIAPDGTGDVHLNADSIRIGDNNADATIATRGTGDLIITTNEGSVVEGIVRLYDGANGNITLTPNGTGQVKVGTDQVVTLVASQTLTNKTISGSSNTLSNIANASLTNSTISGVALGSNLNALTISSPLTGTSFNGSAAVSIGIPVATTSVNGYLSSTDWTTFNNKGSGSVTSVTGGTYLTGGTITTTGTLAVDATSANTASKVVARDASGNFSSGTITANGLDITGSASPLIRIIENTTTGNPKLQLLDYTNISTPSEGTELWYESSTGHSYLSSIYSSGSLIFRTANTEKVRITSAGDVGIGTASPSNKLDVVGVIRATNGSIIANTGATVNAQFILSDNGTNKWQTYYDASAGSYNIYSTTASSVRLSIDSSGNVGIGTTATTPKLNVALGTGYSTGASWGTNVATFGQATGIAGGALALSFDTTSGGILTSINPGISWYPLTLSGQSVLFYINGGEQMRLNSTGLGIGTASPSAKLDVNGSGAFSGTLTVTLPSSVGSISARNSSTTGSELHIRPNSGKNGWLSFTEDAIADRWIVGVKNGNGGLFFNTGNPSSNTDRMVLDSSGNVGIGTASPSQKLSVSNNIILGTAVSGSGTPSYIDTGINYSNGATRDKCKIYLYNSGTEQYGFSVGSSADVQYHSNGIHDFYIANSLALRINSSGNVGIGTSSPASKLNVSGGNVTVSAGYGIAWSGDQARIMTPEDNVSGALIRYGSGGICRFLNGSTEHLRVDSSGNLAALGVFKGNSGTKGFGGITTTTSTSTPTGGSSGDHYYIY